MSVDTVKTDVTAELWRDSKGTGRSVVVFDLGDAVEQAAEDSRAMAEDIVPVRIVCTPDAEDLTP